MNLNQVSQKYQLSQWVSLVHDCRNSGKKVDTWCSENGISRNTYYYWLRRVRKIACEALPTLTVNENPIVPVSFKIPGDCAGKRTMKSDTGITLHIGSVTLELHNGMSSELLTTTLQAINYVR